jgi:hypothetical protein
MNQAILIIEGSTPFIANQRILSFQGFEERKISISRPEFIHVVLKTYRSDARIMDFWSFDLPRMTQRFKLIQMKF